MWIQYRVKYYNIYTGHILFHKIVNTEWDTVKHPYWSSITPLQLITMWNVNQSLDIQTPQFAYRWHYELITVGKWKPIL